MNQLGFQASWCEAWQSTCCKPSPTFQDSRHVDPCGLCAPVCARIGCLLRGIRRKTIKPTQNTEKEMKSREHGTAHCRATCKHPARTFLPVRSHKHEALLQELLQHFFQLETPYLLYPGDSGDCNFVNKTPCHPCRPGLQESHEKVETLQCADAKCGCKKRRENNPKHVKYVNACQCQHCKGTFPDENEYDQIDQRPLSQRALSHLTQNKQFVCEAFSLKPCRVFPI